MDVPLDRILELDDQRRSLLADVERMRAGRNRAGKEIGATNDAEERQRLIEEQRAISGDLDVLEGRLRDAEAELAPLLLDVPNLFHEDVLVGGYEDGVIVIEGDGDGDSDGGGERRVDPPRSLREEPADEVDASMKPHWELGEELGIIDFERGVKVSGSHFYILRDHGARMQRALIAWMLDVHREQGYSEIYPPVLVTSESLVGTGNLPKFGDTMFHAEGTDLWLIPTAEVPVTNMYRDEILDVAALPIEHTAYTPCFRREQFSAGRDVRGIKRGYQFDKVEMVRFVEDGASWQALESLLQDALEIVRALGFRYRVIRLATGDLTFASGDDLRHRALGAGLRRVAGGLLGLELRRFPVAPREPALPRRRGSGAASAHPQRLRSGAAANAGHDPGAESARGRLGDGAGGTSALPRRARGDRALALAVWQGAEQSLPS